MPTDPAFAPVDDAAPAVDPDARLDDGRREAPPQPIAQLVIPATASDPPAIELLRYLRRRYTVDLEHAGDHSRAYLVFPTRDRGETTDTNTEPVGNRTDTLCVR